MNLCYKMFVISVLILSCFQLPLTPAAPKTSIFDLSINPKHHPKNKVRMDYLVVEDSKYVDMKCHENDLESTWFMSRSQSYVVSPFYAQSTSAGEYECSNRRVHLFVTNPMEFYTTTGVDVNDTIKLHCGQLIHTGLKKFHFNLTIFDYSGRVLGSRWLLTANHSTGIELDVDTHKPQIKDLLSSPDVSKYTCQLFISTPHGMKNIHESIKPLMVKLYMPLRNVRPNTTRTSHGQAIQCLSEGVPPAHRYLWRLYDQPERQNVVRPLYLASGNMLKIYDQGDYTFICTAYTLIGEKEYSLSWVGNLIIHGDRKYGERGIGMWVAGGTIGTVVVLVVVVSFVRR